MTEDQNNPCSMPGEDARELDTPNYALFATKREQWIDWLSGDDRHSVAKQITAMTWDAAVFRMVNEARKYAPAASDGNVQLNGMTHDLLNRCFFKSQAIAIRRLLDPRSDTYSLYHLIDDMSQNVSLMTRAHILAAEGKPYDYEPLKRAMMEYLQRESVDGDGCNVPSGLVWWDVENRHKEIDRLSGVAPVHRHPEDTVRAELFQNMKQHLVDQQADIRTWVNKFIAHAASPDSRAIVDADKVKPTLGHLWDMHALACKIATFVGAAVLGDSFTSPLPVPQYNQFKYMDRPFIDKADLPKLVEAWRDYNRESDSWTSVDWDHFVGPPD